jgi:hypothetical protein
MPSEVFEAQAALLVRALPYVAAETCFALKGGTAINLFVRNLPRLSVDIDLVYLPIEDRETDWQLLGLPGVAKIPAIRWKLLNLALLQAKQPEKYRTLNHDLGAMLSGTPRSAM